MKCSVLFESVPRGAATERPECFADLNLDQIVSAATAGREEYDLEPIFHCPMPDVQTIGYRQEVFRDFERPVILDGVKAFCARMRTVRAALLQAGNVRYALQRRRIELDAIAEYCEAVNGLDRELSSADPHSRGLGAFQRHLSSYARSAEFTSLAAETERLQAQLAQIRYAVRIEGKRIEVSRHTGEPDYAREVSRTFAKFRQGTVQERRFTFPSDPRMSAVEEAILDRVALLFAQTFAALARHCERHQGFVDTGVSDFERAAQFYIAWLEYLEPVKKAGLSCCYPRVLDGPKGLFAREAFDLALARKLIGDRSPVVLNDFEIRDPQRILVVSGANQGGKSTFARMVGQICYLAGLGCPVPGREVCMARVDRVFTHFAREERVETLRSKLEENLIRMRGILERSSSRSLVIMNESFDSTTVSDALFLSKQILMRIMNGDMLCVCVTFLDELASLSEKTASYVAVVDSADPARRTFKVVRKPAEGLAYAVAVARKYGLTYEQLKQRLAH